MEKNLLGNRLSELGWLFSLFLLSFSCQQKTNDIELLSKAWSQYEVAKFEIGMQNLEFTGPVMLEGKYGAEKDTNTVVYGWNFVHGKDTFWIYSIVNKSPLKKKDRFETGIGYSENFEDLRVNWKKWQDLRINKKDVK